MHIRKKYEPLPRRTFLMGAGVTLALPLLDAMSVHADTITKAGSISESETPRRAVFSFFGLGINGRDFTPADTGRDYTLSPILKPLVALKNDFTVISGLKLTHSGGHVGDRTFLTGTNTRSAGAKLRISCDQETCRRGGQGDAVSFAHARRQARHGLRWQPRSNHLVERQRHADPVGKSPACVVRSTLST